MVDDLLDQLRRGRRETHDTAAPRWGFSRRRGGAGLRVFRAAMNTIVVDVVVLSRWVFFRLFHAPIVCWGAGRRTVLSPAWVGTHRYNANVSLESTALTPKCC